MGLRIYGTSIRMIYKKKSIIYFFYSSLNYMMGYPFWSISLLSIKNSKFYFLFMNCSL